MKGSNLTDLLWGVYPYLCIMLFLVVPIVRMFYRPFGFSTRATGLYNRDLLGVASLMLHWGLLLLLLGHLAGFIGGLLGLESWIKFFYWIGLIGGFSATLGSIIALVRRVIVPEVRAMSQWDDYVAHIFLIAIMTLALWQVTMDRIFGVAYTASAWVASVARFAPQPELMASASLISKWHVFLALTFFGLFPFTKLVHVWTFPINYFVRPYQSMRTNLFKYQRKWEFALRSDQSFLTYSLGGVVIFFVGFSLLLGRGGNSNGPGSADVSQWASNGKLAGIPLYVSQCARCHGINGQGDGLGAKAPAFATVPRDLTAGEFSFITTDNGIASDADLTRVIINGLVPAGMPVFSELGEEQIVSLVRVVRGFCSEPVDEPGAALEVPPVSLESTAAKGAELFQVACAPCHGASGRGDGPNVATLKDFAGLPLLPRDLAKMRIAAGIPPVMPAYHSAYKPEEIWSIVKFVHEEIVAGKLAHVAAVSPPAPQPVGEEGSFE